MPFLGILEDRKLRHVPGTVVLEEGADHVRSGTITGRLKHGSGRNSHIILIPQPSDDPNDPLNWSTVKKLTAFGVTSFGCILYAAVISGMLNSVWANMSLELDTSIARLVQTNGYQALVVGVTGPIFNALARKYGKRPIFLSASIICLVANIVGSAVNTYNGLLTSRILQGFAIAPYESLIFTLISDMFFVHERGVYAAWINFLLAGISNLVTVVTGPIGTNLGWRWIFYLMVLFTGIQAILQFFFVPETSYNRNHQLDLDEIGNDEEKGELDEKRIEGAEASMISHTENLEGAIPSSSAMSTPIRPKSFLENLSIVSGSFSEENLFQLCLAPLAVFSNLAVAWVIVVNSMFVCFYVVIAFVLSQLFSAPPYLMDPTSVGYLSFGPFVGGVIGTVVLGATLDPFIIFCARRNKGVYEPEYRLVFSIVSLTCGAGLIGWGVVVGKHDSPYAAATLHGLMLFGVMIACVTSSAYALDAYRSMAAEIFIATMTVKNLLVYGFSYFQNNWVAEAGVTRVFYVWGGISLGLSLTAPIVFFYGKRYRSFWARHNLLEKWHIRTHEE